MLVTTLGYCKKKEEPKPVEEAPTAIETEPRQATKNIKLYRDGKAASKEMQKQSEELHNIDKNIEQKKKAPERKSIKDMRSELKNKLDITYKEKVHREKQEYQNKFKR